jgi:cytochrome c oxidase assembly protein subunit 15
MGTLPPLTEADWIAEFEKYQESPEFKDKNFYFGIDEFKNIFWWEYIHRLWGRLLGLVFIIPFLFFVSKKAFSTKLTLRLLLLLILGGFQGFLGWYMVSSGLVNEPRVSHYRLAAHLSAALTTFCLIFWNIQDIKNPLPQYSNVKKQTSQIVLLSIVFLVAIVQIVYGAFVAGLDAGQIHNTWPKMSDEWIADGTFSLVPFYLNLFESLQGIQFVHRTVAIILLLAVYILWINSRFLDLKFEQRQAVNYIFIIIHIQLLLGIFTLIYNVPLWLGVLHQLGAVAFLAAMLLYFHRLRIRA